MTEQERKDENAIDSGVKCVRGKAVVCKTCDYDRFTDCKTALIADLLGVINRKDKRIEELEERIAIMTEDDGLPVTW